MGQDYLREVSFFMSMEGVGGGGGRLHIFSLASGIFSNLPSLET